MAITSIKSTYALDVETVRALERMAERWRVSKSEALRRAIRAASSAEEPETADALKALDELQRSLDLSPDRARAWVRRVRTARRTSSARHETRRG